MRILRLALFIVAFATAAAADELDRTSLYLRDVRPTISRLQGEGLIVPEELLARGTQTDPDSYQLRLEPTRSGSLSRVFNRTVTDFQGAALGIAYQENLTTSALFSLGDRTAMSFTENVTERSDIAGGLLDSRRSRVMDMSQSFGKGESASSLKFTRTSNTDTPWMGKSVSTRTEALEFASGLTKDYDLSLKTTRFASDQGRGVTGDSFATALTLPFSGGATTWSLAESAQMGNGVTTKTQKLDLAMPLVMDGRKTIAEYHSNFTSTNGVEVGTRDAHFLAPVSLFGKPGTVEHRIFGENKGAGMVETRTTRFAGAFELGDKVYNAEETLITLRQGGVYTKTFLSKLTAPLAKSTATVQRQTVRTLANGAETEQRQLAVTLPTLNLSKRLALTASHLSTESTGASGQEVTNLGLQVQPLKPLTVEARYVFDDRGAQPSVTTTSLLSKISLAKDLQLQGQYNLTENPGAQGTSLKLVELVRDRGSSPIGLRAGMATYGTPTGDLEPARRVEVNLGDPQALVVTAAYSEYDPNSRATLGEDNALVAVSIQHGKPEKLALRYRYEDQPTRLEPAKIIDLACPALGGTLQLSYSANPVAPNGTVRQADQYDAALARKLSRDLALQLGFRYLEFDANDAVDQHLRLQVDGGQEAKWGKLALAYTTGDFCKAPAGQTAIPGSQLDVSYHRLWGDNGKLALSLQRRTAPMNVVADGAVEGRVEYRFFFW